MFDGFKRPNVNIINFNMTYKICLWFVIIIDYFAAVTADIQTYNVLRFEVLIDYNR